MTTLFGTLIVRHKRRRAVAGLRSGNLNRATKDYLWLWANLDRWDPKMRGVRVSYIASEIAELVTLLPLARQRFSMLRDETEKSMTGRATQFVGSERLDWIVLNEVLGDAERVATWSDAAIRQMGPQAVTEVSTRLARILVQTKNWTTLGMLFAEPAARLRHAHEALVKTREALANARSGSLDRIREDASNSLQELFRVDVSHLYRGLVAAGRSTEAISLRDEAIRLDGSAEMRGAFQ